MTLHISMTTIVSCYGCDREDKLAPTSMTVLDRSGIDYAGMEPSGAARAAGWRSFSINDFDRGSVQGHLCEACHQQTMRFLHSLGRDHSKDRR